MGTKEEQGLVGGSRDSAQGKADLVKGIMSLPSVSERISEDRTRINIGIPVVGRLFH